MRCPTKYRVMQKIWTQFRKYRLTKLSPSFWITLYIDNEPSDPRQNIEKKKNWRLDARQSKRVIDCEETDIISSNCKSGGRHKSEMRDRTTPDKISRRLTAKHPTTYRKDPLWNAPQNIDEMPGKKISSHLTVRRNKREVSNFTSRPFYPQKDCRYPSNMRRGKTQGWSGTVNEKRKISWPYRDSSSGPSQPTAWSLYPSCCGTETDHDEFLPNFTE